MQRRSEMTKEAIIEEVRKLSLEDRRDLAAVIEESIVEETGARELTPEQEAELHRRVEQYRRQPDDVLTWEQVSEHIDRMLQ